MAVTRYMKIKWVKAAFEIVVAIIIIVFGTKILFGVAPEDAQQRSVFSLLVGLLWFLAIWCIIAAVRNVVLSLRPKPKDSLKTLNEKIDALDKKLVTIGLASETIPDEVPPSPEEFRKRRNKKIMVAAGIVAAMVVLAAITTVFLMTKMGGGGNPAGGLTPEDTFNALITAMNSKDANGVLSLTVYSFGNATMKSQFRQEFNSRFGQTGSSFNITVNSHQIKYPADLNATENSNLSGIQNEIQSRISNTVTASCVIVFNMTITTNQTNFYQDGDMPCFQIDGGWYVLIDFGGGGPDGNGGDNQQNDPQQAFWSLMDNINNRDSSNAVNLTVYKFGNNSEQSMAEKQIGQMWAGSSYFNASASNIWVQNWSSMNPTEQDNLTSIEINVSTHFGVNVQDRVFVHFQITINNDSGPNSTSRIWACLKIDNLWYLVMDEWSSGSPPGITVTMTNNTATNNWTLTVTNVMNVPGMAPLHTSDVFLSVKNATGPIGIQLLNVSQMSTGVYYTGTEFVDTSSFGDLNPGTPGDSFVLNATTYVVGSEFKLTNFDGTQVYCVYVRTA